MPSPAWQRARVPGSPPREGQWLTIKRSLHPPLAAYNQESTGFVMAVSSKGVESAKYMAWGVNWFGVNQQRTVDARLSGPSIMYVSITSGHPGSRMGSSSTHQDPPPPHDCGRPLPVLITRNSAQHLGQIFSFERYFSEFHPFAASEDIHNRFFRIINNAIKQILQDCKKLRCTARPHDPVPGHQPPQQ